MRLALLTPNVVARPINQEDGSVASSAPRRPSHWYGSGYTGIGASTTGNLVVGGALGVSQMGLGWADKGFSILDDYLHLWGSATGESTVGGGLPISESLTLGAQALYGQGGILTDGLHLAGGPGIYVRPYTEETTMGATFIAGYGNHPLTCGVVTTATDLLQPDKITILAACGGELFTWAQ